MAAADIKRRQQFVLHVDVSCDRRRHWRQMKRESFCQRKRGRCRYREREKGVSRGSLVRDCIGSRRDSRLSIIRLLLKPRQELPATKSKKFLARFSNVFGAVSTTTMRQHHEAGRQATKERPMPKRKARQLFSLCLNLSTNFVAQPGQS